MRNYIYMSTQTILIQFTPHKYNFDLPADIRKKNAKIIYFYFTNNEHKASIKCLLDLCEEKEKTKKKKWNTTVKRKKKFA